MAVEAGPGSTSMYSTSSGLRSSSRRGPGGRGSSPKPGPHGTVGENASSPASIRMPSTRTNGPRSATRLCTPRKRIREPIPLTPEARTTSRPGTRLVSTSARLHAPRSRTIVAASIRGRSTAESLGDPGLVSGCWGGELWPRSDEPNGVTIKASATRREEALIATERTSKARAPAEGGRRTAEVIDLIGDWALAPRRASCPIQSILCRGANGR
jgi:hypothetical protein